MKRPSGSRTVHLPPDVVALCDHARLGTPLATWLPQFLRDRLQPAINSQEDPRPEKPKPPSGRPPANKSPCHRCPNLHDLIHTMSRCRCTCHQP